VVRPEDDPRVWINAVPARPGIEGMRNHGTGFAQLQVPIVTASRDGKQRCGRKPDALPPSGSTWMVRAKPCGSGALTVRPSPLAETEGAWVIVAASPLSEVPTPE